MTYTCDLRLTGRDDEMTILFIYLSIYIFCDDMFDDELGELNQGWLVSWSGQIRNCTVVLLCWSIR